MARALRWAGYLLAALLALLLLAAGWVWFASNRALAARFDAVPERIVQPTAAQLADGPRQLKVLGCVGCHGEGLKGNRFMDEPAIATIHAPNLTMLAANATDQQLAQGIRQGIGADGRSLIVMPSAGYSRLGDAEVAALIAAIRALPRAGGQTPPNKIGPLGRIGLLNGKLRIQPELVAEYRAAMPADLGSGFAAGRQIAMTVCSDCHGPTFGGKQVKPGSVAPDLDIAGAYDLPAFTRLMRQGVGAGNKKLGLMGEVSRSDLAHLTDAEIAQLLAYLQERAERAP
jgi:mono/diheme cytochrome c family protein